MDLYSLPKDILVKLVSTIREDTIKEVTSEYEEKFADFNNKYRDKILKMTILEHYFEIFHCSFPNCRTLLMNGEYDISVIGSYDYYQCRRCNNYCCINHGDDYIDNSICHKCKIDNDFV